MPPHRGGLYLAVSSPSPRDRSDPAETWGELTRSWQGYAKLGFPSQMLSVPTSRAEQCVT